MKEVREPIGWPRSWRRRLVFDRDLRNGLYALLLGKEAGKKGDELLFAKRYNGRLRRDAGPLFKRPGRRLLLHCQCHSLDVGGPAPRQDFMAEL